MNLFDIIILAGLVIFTLVGARKGLIMTICGLVAAVLALTGARLAADQFSPALAYAIEPSIRDAVYSQMETSVSQQTEDQQPFQWEGEDGGLLEQIFDSDFYQYFIDSVEVTVQDQVHQATATAADAVAASLARSVAWLATYLLAFLLILFAGHLLGRGLDLAARLPGLRFVNRSLGGLCGFLQGAVIAAVICSLGVGFGLVPKESVESSTLLALFSAFSTISL